MKWEGHVLLAGLLGVILAVASLWFLNTAWAAKAVSLLPVNFSGDFEAKPVLVDDFKNPGGQNRLGGNRGCESSSPGLVSCTVTITTAANFLEMQYDVRTPGSYAWHYSELSRMNLTALDTVWIALRGEHGSEPLYLEFMDCGLSGGIHYPKRLVSNYLTGGLITSTWSAVAIPLKDFSEIPDWSCIDRFNIMAHNQIGSDQGKIYVDDIRLLPDPILLDGFADTKPENDLGGNSGYWTNNGTILYKYTVGNELQLDYNVITTTPVAEASYWTDLRRTNLLSQKNTLFFKVRNSQGSEELAVQLSDCSQVPHPKIKVSDYLDGKITTDWREVAIPLAAFADGINWSCAGQLSFYFDAQPWFNSGQGTVFIDDVKLGSISDIPLLVDHFDDCNQWSALISGWTPDITSTATIDAGPSHQHRYGGNGCGYRIAYHIDGTAGAWVYSSLRDLDVTNYTHLRFWLKGAKGSEPLHVYLVDKTGQQRYYEDIETTNSWQEILIPLNYFYPVSLTNLSEIKFAFEWMPVEGEVYIDDISFTTLQTYLPLVFKDYRPGCSDYMPNCSSPYNNYEPNNYICSTTSHLSSGIPIQSYICSADDRSDYYYIDVNTLNPVNASLTGIPRGVDYDLYLYFNETIVAKSNNFSSANESISYQPTQTGRYYVRVYPYNGHSLTPYTLQVTY